MLAAQIEAVQSNGITADDAEDDGEVKILKRKPAVKVNKTLALLIEQGEAAIDKKDFTRARKLFDSALLLVNSDGKNNQGCQ
jgi:hypothetical protein